jgi:hypothetical protein
MCQLIPKPFLSWDVIYPNTTYSVYSSHESCLIIDLVVEHTPTVVLLVFVHLPPDITQGFRRVKGPYSHAVLRCTHGDQTVRIHFGYLCTENSKLTCYIIFFDHSFGFILSINFNDLQCARMVFFLRLILIAGYQVRVVT